MNSFNEDLELGVRAQNYTIRELSPELGTLAAMEGLFKNYDLISPDGYTLEVKYDKLSRKTNNVGIEFRCNGEPSGIDGTKAMEWVHYFHYQGQVVYSRIKTSNLRVYIESNKGCFPTVRGGDGGRAELYLINKDDFVTRFGYIRTTKRV